jgi:hypothetical protein
MITASVTLKYRTAAIFLLTGWVDGARCASFYDCLSNEYSNFSLPPRRPRSVYPSLRRDDGGAVRDRAALGCGATWAPTEVSALGAADAGSYGPDGVAQAAR